MSRKVALVAGGTGIIGRGLVEHLSSGDDWEVIGLSRTAPDYESRARSVQVDLLDPGDCKAKLGGLGDVTHVFFAAYVERPSEAERVEVNGAMLRNVVWTGGGPSRRWSACDAPGAIGHGRRYWCQPIFEPISVSYLFAVCQYPPKAEN